MKTNRSAGKVRKLRIAILGLTIALAVIAFTMGDSLAARFGHATVRQTEAMPVPNFDLGVLLAGMP